MERIELIETAEEESKRRMVGGQEESIEGRRESSERRSSRPESQKSSITERESITTSKKSRVVSEEAGMERRTCLGGVGRPGRGQEEGPGQSQEQ